MSFFVDGVRLRCFFGFFFSNDTATTEIYTLSLHDALPICCPRRLGFGGPSSTGCRPQVGRALLTKALRGALKVVRSVGWSKPLRGMRFGGSSVPCDPLGRVPDAAAVSRWCSAW